MVFKFIYSVIFIGIFLKLESCYVFHKPDDDTDIMCSRLIVNHLNQNIILKVYSPFDLRSGNIGQDSSWLMEKQGFSDEIRPFDEMNTGIDSIVVYSVDGKILKAWRKFQKTENKRQFFDESSWKKREWKGGNYINYEWTFELVTEDLKITKQD